MWRACSPGRSRTPATSVEIIEMFRASAADDRLGIPVRLDGDKIHYAYPVAILAATRPAR